VLRSPEGICVRAGHQQGDGHPFDDDRRRVRREGSIGDGGRGGTGECVPVPRDSWWPAVPEHLKTQRKQAGLKLNSTVKACVADRHEWYWLYDEAEALAQEVMDNTDVTAMAEDVAGEQMGEDGPSFKEATEEGRLGGAVKVSTARPNPHAHDPRTKVICV
jgi:hypothetical protein